MRINLKCAYRTINKGFCDKKVLKIEPKIEEIFHVMRRSGKNVCFV